MNADKGTPIAADGLPGLSAGIGVGSADIGASNDLRSNDSQAATFFGGAEKAPAARMAASFASS